MNSNIIKIIDSSFIDGPGNRMVIFFQQCNMACIYCHNPETQRLCINCGDCVKECHSEALTFENEKVIWNYQKCTDCGNCIKQCRFYSNPKYKSLSVEETLNYVLKYKEFLQGVTFSGGECTLNSDFIIEFAKGLKEKSNLSVFIDSNGRITLSKLKELCKYVDGFMFDLKAYDEKKHFDITGVSNDITFESIKYASASGLLYEIRTVILKGYTDSLDEIRNISTYIKTLNDYTKLKLIKFRPIGVKTKLKDEEEFNEEAFNPLYLEAQRILEGRVVRV